MRLFSCVCGQVVYFENVLCTHCGRSLMYLPDYAIVSAVEPREPAQPTGKLSSQRPEPGKPGEGARMDDGARVNAAPRIVRALAPVTKGALYRACKNGTDHAICNWAVRNEDDDPYCRSCRMNDIVPDLTKPDAKDKWHRLELAKRRLLYTMMELELPLETRKEKPEGGLAFSFMADEGDKKVFTGHSDGLITVNIAEADDPFREKTRNDLGEAYRTLLGHFRHESGHYYWDRLIKGTARLDDFRQLFGDEQASYADAIKRHYDKGRTADWSAHFVSAYAAMHPWEDWAETWAHYLHMVDTLETARSHGIALRIKPRGAAAKPLVTVRRVDFDDFDDLLSAWVPLTLTLNSLNRAMGLSDLYPFVLSQAAIDKLRFVHDVIEAAGRPASLGRLD